jgi:hypothetical protein
MKPIKFVYDIVHSYFAGKNSFTCLLFLQQPTSKFGPLVQIDAMVKEFKNVTMTCSKSGKLTTKLYASFWKDGLHPYSYVVTKDFLLLADWWRAQTNPSLYNKIFVKDKGETMFNLKVIMPKNIPLCQPCDIHFYRQITNFMKHQYCAHMLCEEEEISSHEDATKLHLLLHHQVHESAFEHVIICMVCFKTDKW